MNCFSTREEAFSLVELMVAVGIIGVMSSVAVPKYQKFRANAAQAEAQATLSSIYTLQQLYYTENDRYGKYVYERTGPGNEHTKAADSDDEIGFHPPATARYHYSGKMYTGAVPPTEVTTPSADAVAFMVVADAQKPLGSCVGKGSKAVTDPNDSSKTITIQAGDVDKWCINENKVLGNTHAGNAHQPCGTTDVKFGGC